MMDFGSGDAGAAMDGTDGTGAETAGDRSRQADGRFAAGASGNPAGRPRGARNMSTRAMEALLQGQQEALTRMAISKAMEGDVGALRLCLHRLMPVRRDAPLQFALPPVRSAADAMNASSALLQALANGEVTPDEAGRVMTLLTAHKRMVEGGVWDPTQRKLLSWGAYRKRFPGGFHDIEDVCA